MEKAQSVRDSRMKQERNGASGSNNGQTEASMLVIGEGTKPMARDGTFSQRAMSTEEIGSTIR